MKYLLICVALIFSVAFTGCASTQDSRSTGQYVDDASITTRVKTQIAQTQGLGEALKINVDTYRGVVSLAGFVDNATQVRAAADAASQVQGVERVKNNLLVKPKP